MRSRPIRVCNLITEYSPLFSGHAVYLRAFFPYLKSAGVEPLVLTGDFERMPAHDCIDGVRVSRFRYHPQQAFSDLFFALRVVRWMWLHRGDYDIFHYHGFLDQYGLFVLAGRLLGKPVTMQMVLVGADDPATIRRTYRFMMLRFPLLARTTRFFCISRRLVEICFEEGIDARRVRHTPQGVDIHRFAPPRHREKQTLRGELGLPESEPVACFVGAIIYRKGVDILLEAWKRIQADCRDAHLLLVGPDSFGDEQVNSQELASFLRHCREFVRQHSLNATFTGRTDAVDRFLRASDVLAFPSRKEGFGNVILEAMACGVVPIVTPMDGVASETVVHGVNGFIVSGAGELSQRCLELFRDPGLRSKLSAEARRHAVEKFSFEKTASMFYTEYRQLHPVPEVP